MERLTHKQAIERHIAECKHRMEVIDEFMDNPSADIEGCNKNIFILKTVVSELEQVQQLKERDTAKRPDTSSKCEEHTHYKCPTCGNVLMTVYKGTRVGMITEFCEKCGQRLEQSE